MARNLQRREKSSIFAKRAKEGVLPPKQSRKKTKDEWGITGVAVGYQWGKGEARPKKIRWRYEEYMKKRRSKPCENPGG